jgi:hypothetical protein
MITRSNERSSNGIASARAARNVHSSPTPRSLANASGTAGSISPGRSNPTIDRSPERSA